MVTIKVSLQSLQNKLAFALYFSLISLLAECLADFQATFLGTLGSMRNAEISPSSKVGAVL